MSTRGSLYSGSTGTSPTDVQNAAIAALATAIAGGGLPGDAALAGALQATAAQPAGVGLQSSAQEVLALAQVLVDGGGITSAQYHDVLNVLQSNGVTMTTTPVTAPSALFPGPLFQGHGHGHDQGDGGGG